MPERQFSIGPSAGSPGKIRSLSNKRNARFEFASCSLTRGIALTDEKNQKPDSSAGLLVPLTSDASRFARRYFPG